MTSFATTKVYRYLLQSFYGIAAVKFPNGIVRWKCWTGTTKGPTGNVDESNFQGFDPLALVGIKGCLTNEQEDVIEIADRCALAAIDMNNVREVFEYILKALPAESVALFTRQFREWDRPVLWINWYDTEEDGFVPGLNQKLSSVTLLDEEKCTCRKPNGEVCNGHMDELSPIGRGGSETPYLVVASEDGSASEYKSKGNDPVTIDSCRFLLKPCTAKDVKAGISRLRPVEVLQKYGRCQNILLGACHVLSQMEKALKVIENVDASDFRGFDPLALVGIKGCLTNEQEDVIEIADQCSPQAATIDMNNVREVFEYVLKALPAESVALFTRQVRSEVNCQTCKNVEYRELDRPILWIDRHDTAEDGLVAGLNQKLSSVTLLDEEKCTCRKPNVMEVKPLAVCSADGSSSRYKSKGNDPVTIDSCRFLLVGAVSIGETFEDDVEAWYKCPSTGWIYCETHFFVFFHCCEI
uniref:USP domain-containing protein n=1 Tax=Caenorhabditis tropicalis TaxID=1561998 RepID=A0A1I7T362_9PELO